MSNTVIRLRVCGSKHAGDFLKAFDYYSLWSLTNPAKKLLQKEARMERRIEGEINHDYVSMMKK